MVAHTGLDKTNPSCLLKIHQDFWLEMGLSLQGGSEPHVCFDTKFDGDPLSRQFTPSWESGRRGLASPARTRGFTPAGLFSSRLALLQQLLLHLAHRHLCLFLAGSNVTHSTRSLLGAGVLGGGGRGWWLPPAAASPRGSYIKAVEHVCSGHRQWGMRWVDD